MPAKSHKCAKNWSQSAKAMESDIIVELLKQCKDKGKPVGTYIGDDDTSTICRARREVDSEIEKASDKTHVTKNLGKHLYEIKGDHRELTRSVITYLQRNFKFMLAQNAGNLDEIKKGLKACVEHPFGQHQNCGEWCGYLKDPDSFKHSGIPGGKDLKSAALKKDLERVFDLPPEKLVSMGSTQPNESLNGSIGSKAQKRVYHGDSNSVVYRIKSGVLQKNEGHGYPATLNVMLGMSPSRGLLKRAHHLDIKAAKKRKYQATPKFKFARNLAKRQRNEDELSKEAREGDTYKSNIGMDHPELDTPSAEPTEIPAKLCKPLGANYPCPFPRDTEQTVTFVFFDLETSSLERTSDILQIGAVVDVPIKRQFSTYMVPSQKIKKGHEFHEIGP